LCCRSRLPSKQKPKQDKQNERAKGFIALGNLIIARDKYKHQDIKENAAACQRILVNNSILALLDKRDADDESFIAEEIVASFVYDMYGIEIVDFSEFNADMPSKEGYVYIIPRGYSVYNHNVTDIIENEDGTFTVSSKVVIDEHDDVETEFSATTLFVKNENSTFGYNIIYSDIIENTIAI